MESLNQRAGNLPDSRYCELQRYNINQPAAAVGQPRLPQSFVVGESVNLRVEEESFSETSSSDEYSADSCSSCSGSSSRTYIPEWETHIDSNGELYYVRFSSNQQSAKRKDSSKENQVSEQEREKMMKKKKKSRLSRLLKRRKGVQSPRVVPPCESPAYLPTETVQSPADDWSDWTSFNIELEVHPTLEGSSSGRRKISNLCESLLGFVPGVTQSVDWHGEISLRQRVMVDKLIPGGPLHQGFAHVQQGDWLEKLNGNCITHRDLNNILSSISSREIVELNFRRRPFVDGSSNQEESGASPMISTPHGILLLSNENVTETSAEMDDVLYQSSTAGIDALLKWRGIGLTLSHLLPQLTRSVPVGSSVIAEGLLIHLGFVIEDAGLFILAAPSTWCTSVELELTTKQLNSLLCFQYGSIRRALTEPRFADDIRRMVDSLFHSLQNRRNPLLNSLASSYWITCGHWLHLPADVHLDVTLTLNQMEAMDYEDWDDETISLQRSVTMTGSAVYCQGYLVGSTLSPRHLEQVGTYLKWNQILEISLRRRLRSLILWREIFPNTKSEHRSFIIVVGSGHILIAVLLESGGVGQPWDDYPDTFLIEELQMYLEELQYLKLETICDQILNGPQNPVLVSNLSNTEMIESRSAEMSRFNITAGLKPTLINYLLMDFGTGIFIAPPLVNAETKFIEQFQKTALGIHKLFQNTLKSKVDLQRSDWGGPWSDKSLVALQEVSVLFTIPCTTPHQSKDSMNENSCWVTGRLFSTPSHRELYVCYQDGVPQDILDLCFHLSFGALL